ncbi:hypothetical protein BDP55DRAFT_720597 [Colletotrichum godetiae]|uniref:Uncharacterized protein n=1 Tax=Colletotrichum godetiae TaxID=1209918 RepID=A0AAJ0A9P2_9PEZI|nr:uncharacterized protein BDP55DRAFT_720597 [Colletotrichum godetiae]KAK1658544.1 hypothetical protein BDP55DRAFT_720597 [Colletotrichum godetiae]
MLSRGCPVTAVSVRAKGVGVPEMGRTFFGYCRVADGTAIAKGYLEGLEIRFVGSSLGLRMNSVAISDLAIRGFQRLLESYPPRSQEKWHKESKHLITKVLGSTKKSNRGNQKPRFVSGHSYSPRSLNWGKSLSRSGETLCVAARSPSSCLGADPITLSTSKILRESNDNRVLNELSQFREPSAGKGTIRLCAIRGRPQESQSLWIVAHSSGIMDRKGGCFYSDTHSQCFTCRKDLRGQWPKDQIIAYGSQDVSHTYLFNCPELSTKFPYAALLRLNGRKRPLGHLQSHADFSVHEL